MIEELLPQYYSDQGEGSLTYRPVRSFVIDGHEVWWAEYRGKRYVEPYDDFTGHSVVCECDFTPGVGYRVEDKSIVSLEGERDCIPRAVACYMRRLELRKEYLKFYGDRGHGFSDGNFVLSQHIKEIVLDLMARAKKGEFLGEDGYGAAFWGGYFYVQTVADIVDRFMGDLWTPLYALAREKKISLEGSVIQDYVKPPPPQWEEYLRLEEEGYVATASLPGNRHMAREWKFEVTKPDGSPAYSFIPGLGLGHDPIFGPDVDDVERAEEKLKQLIAESYKGDAETRLSSLNVDRPSQECT